jgi:hypothetical protein
MDSGRALFAHGSSMIPAIQFGVANRRQAGRQAWFLECGAPCLPVQLQ